MLDDTPADDRPPRSLARAMQLLDEAWHWEADSPLAVELIFSELATDAQTRPPASATCRLQRVVERLEDDATAPTTLQELAALADLHPVYLARPPANASASRRATGCAVTGCIGC